MAVCPHLTYDNRCSIYERRYSCCRSFPNRGQAHFCVDSNRCVYTEDGKLDCLNCKDCCCRNIFIKKTPPYTEADFKEALDISCERCDQTWSNHGNT